MNDVILAYRICLPKQNVEIHVIMMQTIGTMYKEMHMKTK